LSDFISILDWPSVASASFPVRWKFAQEGKLSTVRRTERTEQALCATNDSYCVVVRKFSLGDDARLAMGAFCHPTGVGPHVRAWFRGVALRSPDGELRFTPGYILSPLPATP